MVPILTNSFSAFNAFMQYSSIYACILFVPLFIYLCKCVVVVTVPTGALNVTFSGQRFVLRAKLKTCFGVFILTESLITK